jgi:hypothetical protein
VKFLSRIFTVITTKFYLLKAGRTVICRHCKGEVEYDAVTPFCETCFMSAVAATDKAAEQSVLRWVARID